MEFVKKNVLGFTLVETLIAMSIVGVIGAVMVDLIRISFEGNSKAALINSIKQNGQVALISVEESLRFADKVVCSYSNPDDSMIAVIKDGKYTRIKIYGETALKNGYIAKDFPTTIPESELCNSDLLAQKQYITSENSGISVQMPATNGGFSVDSQAGFSTIVTVRFDIKESKNAPSGFENQIGAIPFQTSIQLR